MVSEFQFAVVLVAIIFGLSLTHVMSAVARIVFAHATHQYGLTRLVWTFFTILVLLLNWWVTFAWQKVEVWSFDLFITFTTWAGFHYWLAISLFPFNGMGTDIQIKNWSPRPFLIIFLGLLLLDIVQTAMRGQLFAVPYYLHFTLHYLAITVLALVINTPRLYTALAWYLMTTVFWWGMLVRRFIN